MDCMTYVWLLCTSVFPRQTEISTIYTPPIRPRLMALYKCALIDWLIDWLISDSSLLGQTSLLDCKDNHYGNNLSHAVWNLCTTVTLLGPKSVARAMGATSLRRSTMPVSCPFHGCNALLRIVKRSYRISSTMPLPFFFSFFDADLSQPVTVTCVRTLFASRCLPWLSWLAVDFKRYKDRLIDNACCSY